MAEKYLVWPIRIFLYLLAIVISLFYSLCLFMATEYGARFVAKNVFQDNLNFNEIKVQPSLLGIKIKMQDFYYRGAADFYGEELALEINFLNSVISNHIYIPSLDINSSEVKLVEDDASSSSNQPNLFINNLNITNFRIGDTLLENINFQKVLSEGNKIIFNLKDLNIKLPGSLENIKNLDGAGYFSNGKLSLNLENENAALDFIFYDEIKNFQNFKGYLSLDFNDKFSIPYGFFSSADETSKLNVSFKYNEDFTLSLFATGNSNILNDLIPDTIQDTKDFLNESEYQSNNAQILFSLFSAEDIVNFSGIASLENNSIKLNQLNIDTSEMTLYIDNNFLRIFGDDILLSGFEADKFSLSKNLSLESPYELLIEQGNKFNLTISESGKIKSLSGIIGNYSDSSMNVIFKNKSILVNSSELYVQFDYLDNFKVVDNGIRVFPKKFKSNYFALEDNSDNYFDFDFRDNSLRNLNAELVLTKEFEENNFENLKFDELKFVLSNSYLNFNSDELEIGGLFNINGKNISYSDSTFNIDALRVLSLIDIRSRLLNIINADFEKLDQNNFFINDLNGEFFADSSGYANINNLNLNFDAGSALLKGTVFSSNETFDTFNLDLTFSTKLSQNIPWYVAIIGGFPAAAGAVVVTDILQEGINDITKTNYSISGNVDNLDVSVKQ